MPVPLASKISRRTIPLMRRLRGLFFGLVLVSIYLLPVEGVAKRVALVIGNSAYAENPLKNPVADADAIASLLETINFKVIKGLDLQLSEMNEILRGFLTELGGAEIALLYFSGHGVQLDDENYAIPIDSSLSTESDILLGSVKISTVLEAMERQAETSITILDACRNNPFEAQLVRSMGKARSQSLGRGLAGIQAGSGSIVVFATAPDQIAYDGSGANSPFTSALLRHLPTPNSPLSSIMTRVTADVFKATGERQRPYTTMSLLEDVYLVADAAGSTNLPALPKDTPTASEEQPVGQTDRPASLAQATTVTWNVLEPVDTAPSRDRLAPAPLRSHAIVNSRIGPERFDYWRISLEPGEYNFVIDAEDAQDRQTHYYHVEFILDDGGTLGAPIKGFAWPRNRIIRTFKIETQTDVTISVGNSSAIMDYALTFAPIDTEIPTPYLVKDKAAVPIALGDTAEAAIEGYGVEKGEVIYEVDLEARDYRFDVEFSSLRDAGYVAGAVSMFSNHAQTTPGPSKTACLIAGPGPAEACSLRLSLADPGRVFVKLHSLQGQSLASRIKISEVE